MRIADQNRNMSETADLHADKNAPLLWPPAQSRPQAEAGGDPLREALKRCSTRTYEAARQFRRTRDAVHLPVIILGIIEHYVEPDLRPKLKTASDDLRLHEDLGVDSLTRIQIIMLVEETLELVIDDKELMNLKTLGEVRRFVERVASAPAGIAPGIKATS